MPHENKYIHVLKEKNKYYDRGHFFNFSHFLLHFLHLQYCVSVEFS